MTQHAHHADRAGNRASIVWFLAAAFIPTFAAEAWLAASGLRLDGQIIGTVPMLWILGIMWIPGLAALGVHVFVEKRDWRELGLRFGPWRAYADMLLLIPALCAAMYGLTWLIGLAEPDTAMSGLTTATGAAAPSLRDIFLIMLPMSIVVGTPVNAVFALGEELGWRGFLLPRLLHLGRFRAYTLLGVIWGLWHAPLIMMGFNYPGHPVAGIGMMCLLCTAFGALLGECRLRWNSVLVAAWMHGAANAQGYGIWPWLFPDANPLLGGFSGLTGVAVWSLAALIAFRMFRR
ncbi:CPBP family intramembrane glutamic endopeptidase [Pseudodesulfovibrio tunisiensis]|uniref:CPBP family intramembrane glutamic endopeptidase n=1 Tax=Pseudodesulfovibrio tunisiensis TaxID=463192 RepID=UPI001FB47AA8|nr:CPBP family intramembrane glutamic endopeptidase [Pseudodesulfovibrio tunisiensis]